MASSSPLFVKHSKSQNKRKRKFVAAALTFAPPTHACLEWILGRMIDSEPTALADACQNTPGDFMEQDLPDTLPDEMLPDEARGSSPSGCRNL